MSTAFRQLAAIMFVDMVGYTALMQEKNLSCLYFYNSPLFDTVNGEERMIQLRRKFGLPV